MTPDRGFYITALKAALNGLDVSREEGGNSEIFLITTRLTTITLVGTRAAADAVANGLVTSGVAPYAVVMQLVSFASLGAPPDAVPEEAESDGKLPG